MERMTLSKDKKRVTGYILTAIFTVFSLFSSLVVSQEALKDGSVAPMGQWLEYREADYRGAPIYVHLRTGYERAIVMPEPVELQNPDQRLPGSEILISDNIVAFYPTRTFSRRATVFVGLETGLLYDLRIRASTEGMRQPMRISR